MPLLPTELLRKLGSGVRPDGAQKHRPGAAAAPINFSELVESARAGHIRSDRPVSWDRPDHEDALERARSVIEQALDRAEAAGISTLLIAHGSALLKADVARRAVTEIESDGASVLALEAEAVLVLALEEDSVGELRDLEAIESGTRSAKRTLAAGIGWITNRSLGEVIAASERREDQV